MITYPNIVRGLILFLDEFRQGDFAVGNEIVWGHGRIMEHCEANFLSIPEQVSCK